MATIKRVAIATQFVSATDGIDCSIFISNVFNCGSIFSPFLLKYVGCFIV